MTTWAASCAPPQARATPWRTAASRTESSAYPWATRASTATQASWARSELPRPAAEGAKFLARTPSARMYLRHRNEIAGATYNVMARGVDRRRIFVDDDDHQNYIGLLAIVVTRQGWRLLCYCLMPNHVHLLIQTPDTNLANGMQWLHGRYARLFNERHGRVGHLFESPYKSPVVTEEDLVRTVGYIVANPLAAALCKRATEWPWCSHVAIANGRRPEWLAHDLLLQRLDEAAGFKCYSDLVAARETLCAEHARTVRERAAERRAVAEALALSTLREVL